MANQEHLDILNQGVESWNLWRKEHPEVQPDLRSADLINTDLDSINLIGARLGRASLSHAHLIGANLRRAHLEWTNLDSTNLNGANLNHSNLRRASLSNANLSNSHLYSANLSNSDLTNACLYQADLRSANLGNAILSNSDLTNALIGWSQFDNVDLRTVKGLETLRHEGPSSIGIDTVYASYGEIPEAFLKGVGVDDTFIAYVRSLVGKPIEYYSCFISYSNNDEAFAKRLYADLQNNNVRCWFAPEDMKTGDVIRSRIDDAIHMHDKLLLILSQHSVESSWVEKEVETAFEKERRQKRHVLFPVRLDDVVLRSQTGWAADIRRMRHITDFSDWKDHDTYQKAFARLLRDLKAEI